MDYDYDYPMSGSGNCLLIVISSSCSFCDVGELTKVIVRKALFQVGGPNSANFRMLALAT